MKRVVVIALLIVAMLQTMGQVPQRFSYQAVLRNTDGTVLVNQAVNIKISLHKTEVAGTVVYSEVHSTTTSNVGVISLPIGGGVVENGTFASIPWNENIFIQVDVKKTGESTYVTMGTSQILSVPYAITAGNVKEVTSSAAATTDDPIFVVKNKDGKIVFAVYQGGVRIYVDDAATKGARGGFAIGGITNQGKSDVLSNIMFVDSDSTRINFKENATKGARGGFAIGGITNQGKSSSNSTYFKVKKDSTYFNNTIYAQADIVTTGVINSGVGVSSTEITDYDGNTYKTVQIGSQTWMKENLKAIHFLDGTAIPSDSVLVYNGTTNTDTINNYGRLYSYYVVDNPLNVCPSGWHVPTIAEWKTLMAFVGGANWQNSTVAVIASLKDTTSGVWTTSNIIGSNNTGFTARPAGQATYYPGWSYNGMGDMATWWGNNNSVPAYVSIEELTGPTLKAGSEGSNSDARSIRCIKN